MHTDKSRGRIVQFLIRVYLRSSAAISLYRLADALRNHSPRPAGYGSLHSFPIRRRWARTPPAALRRRPPVVPASASGSRSPGSGRRGWQISCRPRGNRARPCANSLESHTFAAGRLHGDDTTVPVLAKGKTHTGRCWVYVRDDRPFGGTDPPAAVFYYSRDRCGEHPQAHLIKYSGILQADAYGGYTQLYESGRSPGPIIETRQKNSWVSSGSGSLPSE